MTQSQIPAAKPTASDIGELPKSLTRPDVGAAMQPVDGENDQVVDLIGESTPYHGRECTYCHKRDPYLSADCLYYASFIYF